MKKKFRDITVDGVLYAWMMKGTYLKIWLNKKVIFEEQVKDVNDMPTDHISSSFVIEKINSVINGK
jgi:hypothetical protein